MDNYELYYVVQGVPFSLENLSYNEALKHCELLELDKLTDKYELRQIIKTYERKITQNGHKQDNNTSSQQQNTRTCQITTCRHKKICRQLQLLEL